MNNRLSGWWIGAEAIAIIGSILLAFAIEAWWSDRQEAGETERILAALEVETIANIAEINQKARYRQAVSEICDAVLAAAPDKISTVDFDGLLGDLTWWERADLNTAAISSLVNSGKLALLDDTSLSLQISKVQEEISRTQLVDSLEAQRTDELLIPLLLRNGSLPQISNVATKRGIPGGLEAVSGEYVPDEGKRDHRELLVSDEFRGIVLLKKWVQDDALLQYELAKKSFAELLKLLQPDSEE